MPLEIINKLIDRFSCELILAEPDEPESLSEVLPILKEIHALCVKANMKSEAKVILKAQKLVNAIQKYDPQDNEVRLSELEDLMSDFSKTIRNLDRDKQTPDLTTIPSDRASGLPEDDDYSQLESNLRDLRHLISTFSHGKISDPEGILNNLEDLIALSKNIENDTFHEVARACINYIEKAPRENACNCTPIEEGLILLKSLLNHLKRGEPFTFYYSDVLELLETRFDVKQHTEEIKLKAESSVITDEPKPEKISEEDMELLTGFISEAEESLDTIEVNLIELEQDPTNIDIINNIFRPFHTIKGVSGFLSLIKINKLSHTTEDLLDGARSGDFIINQAATDAVLESVDTIKSLLDRVKQGAQTGFKLPDNDISVDALIEKLEQLQTELIKGEKEPIGEILIREKAIDRESLDQALEHQKSNPDKKIGEILIEDQNVQTSQVVSALMEQSSTKKIIDEHVKVSTRKLDDLVDYAGELVIAQSMLRQKTAGDTSLSQNVNQLGQIVNNMQTIAMSMRMIPIKATFMKMIRLVRDLSRKSDKDVKLSMSGEDTEIDRNLVDALYEPMVHMIRNSVDHGIESSSDRIESGKPAQGNIDLRAYHRGGNIVIEIEDDGMGLDKDKIIEKAISTGLIDGNEQMTDTQVFDLIMQPGFSTASEITDISGRGVGMDVVKVGIEKFRGHLTIESEKGKGTRFTISLPLTLAIIDGMMVQVDNEKYVIPTIAVHKAFKPAKDQYFTVEGKGEMVKDSDSLIPLIRLNEIYGSSNQNKSMEDCLVVVVESKDEKRALLIDELLGKDEYVIKNLGGSMKDVKGIAGGAILADGRVGLILDIHGIFSFVSGN